MACSSACPTQDHANWGDCVRAKGLRAQWLGGTGPSQSDQRKFQGVNDRYRSAVRQGLTPDAVSHRSIDRALKQAESQG